MSMILKCFAGEKTKLFARKKYKVFFLIELFILVLTLLLFNLMNKTNSLWSSANSFPLLVLPIMLDWVIPLFMLMTAADLFSVELTDHSMRSLISRPISRTQIYIAKCLTIILYAAIHLIFVYITTVLLSLTVGKASFSAMSLLHDFAAYALSIVPLITMALVCTLIALTCKGPTMTMFVGVLIYIATRALALFYTPLNAVFFNTHMSWYKMILGQSFSQGLSVLGLFVSYGAIAFILAKVLFERHDF